MAIVSSSVLTGSGEDHVSDQLDHSFARLREVLCDLDAGIPNTEICLSGLIDTVKALILLQSRITLPWKCTAVLFM